MPKFLITYKTVANDISNAWTTADYASEAIDNVMDDYWDVKEILKCMQISSD